jgi:hypothetical protein
VLRHLRALLVFSLLCGRAIAQQSAPPPGSSAPSAQSQQERSEEILRQEEKQRALGVVPLFSMTSVHNAPPLTPKQKWQLMLKSQLDPFTFVSAGLTAGIGQATDSFTQYGQGAQGYAKRYAAALADNADTSLFSNYVYPVLFHEDPRYFRLGEGTIRSRIDYSLAQVVVTKKDSGGRTFNFAYVLGVLTAGAISNVYYPSHDRGLGLTASRAGIALGYGSVGNLFLEFWPDINQRLFHHKPPQPIAAGQ